MDIADFLAPASIIPRLSAADKKGVLEALAARAAALTGRAQQAIYELLLERERLGSTGIGGGTAIPHGKVPDLPRLHGIFARLEKPVDFAAVDDEPVDLFFLLLAPASAGADHLKALARVSRLFRVRALCEKLRSTDRPDALYALLTGEAASHAA